jgi:hypothetical protein
MRTHVVRDAVLARRVLIADVFRRWHARAVQRGKPLRRGCSEKGVRLAQNMHVGPRIAVGIQP